MTYPSAPDDKAKIIVQPQPAAKQRRYALVAILASSAFAFIFGLGRLGFLGPDEPRYAEVAREILPEQLRELGATVDVIPVYRTIAPAVDAASLTKQFCEGRVAAVTFTSSSTVRNFVEVFGGRDAVKSLVARVVIACIGPITARTAEEYGLTVTVMPAENTVPALAEAIVKHFKEVA